MRGGGLLAAALLVCLSACAAPETVVEKPKPKPSDPPSEAPRPPQESPVYVFPGAAPNLDPAGGGLKTQGGVVPTKVDPPPKPDPMPEDVLGLQKDLAARRPGSDDEKLRLAFLYASMGKFIEADEVLASLRSRPGKLASALDLFLRHQLGEHKEEEKLLRRFSEEDRQAGGVTVERAQLCSRIKRFRDYVPAESDLVRPGGTVLLYVEPRNFSLQRQQDRFILHLKYEWKLFDDRSVEVPIPAWDNAPPADREDRNSYAGPVEEFYQSFALPLPVNLAMGRYRVKVTVTDAHSGKSDRVYVPISVAAVEKGK